MVNKTDFQPQCVLLYQMFVQNNSNSKQRICQTSVDRNPNPFGTDSIISVVFKITAKIRGQTSWQPLKNIDSILVTFDEGD